MDPTSNWIYIEQLGKGFLPGTIWTLPGTVWTLPELPKKPNDNSKTTSSTPDRRATPSSTPPSPKRKATELKK